MQMVCDVIYSRTLNTSYILQSKNYYSVENRGLDKCLDVIIHYSTHFNRIWIVNYFTEEEL